MVAQRARPRAWLGKPMSICRTNSAVKALIGRVICSSLTTATPDPAEEGRWYRGFPRTTGPLEGNSSSEEGQEPGHETCTSIFTHMHTNIFTHISVNV